MGAKVAVVALVDDEGVFGNGFGLDFVGVEEEDDFGCDGSNFGAGSDKSNVVGSGM